MGGRGTLGALAAALVVAGLGCGGESSGDPQDQGHADAAAPVMLDLPGARPRAGRWEGVTSQGFPIVFTVEDTEGSAAIAFLAFEWLIATCERQSAVTFPDLAPVVDGRLVARVETPTDVTSFGVRFTNEA